MQDAIKVETDNTDIQNSSAFVEQSKTKYTITGESHQMLIVELKNGAKLLSRPGTMAWMTPDIRMATIKRFTDVFNLIFRRRNSFLNVYDCPIGVGVVALSPQNPGKILSIELSENNLPEVLIERNSFLAAAPGIKISKVTIKKSSILRNLDIGYEKISGNGAMHIVSNGDAVIYTLRDGEELDVDEVHLLGFDSTLTVSFRRVKEGLTNIIFGGEGLYIAKIKGPGRVWLQSNNPNSTTNTTQRIAILIALLLALLALIY